MDFGAYVYRKRKIKLLKFVLNQCTIILYYYCQCSSLLYINISIHTEYTTHRVVDNIHYFTLKQLWLATSPHPLLLQEKDSSTYVDTSVRAAQVCERAVTVCGRSQDLIYNAGVVDGNLQLPQRPLWLSAGAAFCLLFIS